MFDQLGGRKMVAAVLIVAIGVSIAFVKGDVPSNLLQLLEVVFGVFVTANTVNTASSHSLEKAKALTPISPNGINPDVAIRAFDAMSAAVAEHGNKTHQMLDSVIKSTQVTQQALSMVAEKVLSK